MRVLLHRLFFSVSHRKIGDLCPLTGADVIVQTKLTGKLTFILGHTFFVLMGFEISSAAKKQQTPPPKKKK